MAHFGSDLLISVKSAFCFNGKLMNIFTFFLTLGGVCLLVVCGASAAGSDRVSVFVMEGDTVTLHTDVEMNQQDRIGWYFYHTRIAEINRDLSFICTDVQCYGGTERFRDRLKLDNQTGSLTIRDIKTTDSGEYTLKITSRNIDNIFSVTVHGVSAAKRDEMKRKSVKEGESVTLETRVIKNTTDLMRWYFNNISIAEITGDQSKICSDDECKERFRDRLKLNNQTGSLIITNTTITDSGDYKLKISSSRCSIMRSFTVTVSVKDVSDSGSSSAAAVVVVVVVVALLLLPAVVFYNHQVVMKCIRRKCSDEIDDAQDTSRQQTETLMQMTSNGTSHNKTEAADQTQL